MGRTTIAINDNTKKRFITVKGILEQETKEIHSEDDVMNKLIDTFLMRRKKCLG